MTFKCSATIVILQYLLLSACNCVLSQGQGKMTDDLCYNYAHAAVIVIRAATEIIRHPRDQTVRCLEAAEFSCRASDAGYINWRVNGTSRNRLPLFRDTSVEGGFLENSSTWSTLTFTNSRPHYNGTSVQCVAGVGGSGAPPVRSDVAYLRVLRTLSSCHLLL